MDQIIKVFMSVFFIFVLTLASVGLISANIKSNQAVSLKADIINEIENSNYNESVIAACIEQGKQQGYDVEINVISYDDYNNAKMAEVIITYDYEVPIFNISSKHQTSGYAR